MGKYAFQSCYSLKTVKLPASYAVSESMFYNCYALTSIDVSGATSFADWAFENCWSLKSVKLPGGLDIPDYMFRGCSTLETLAFTSGGAPASVGTNAFLYVPSSGKVYYPTGQIGYDTAFDGTPVAGWGLIPTIAPTISAHPAGQSKKPGETALFSVTATSDPSPDYQWQVSADSGATWTDIANGGVYSGAATATLTLTGVQAAHNGNQYRCVVSSIAHTGVKSNAATLTVLSSVLTASPAALSFGAVTAGTASAKTLTVSGRELKNPISYEITGANAGAFRVTEAGWNAASGGALTVRFAPASVQEYSATLTLTSAGAAPVSVSLTGSGRESGNIGPAYEYRTLTDPSGVRVSGLFTGGTMLEVRERLLHPAGTCDVCGDIRERQEKGELIVLFDIALKSGESRGELDVEIPVGGKYDGQSVVLLHCKDKVLESRTVTVENGIAKGRFTSLSPYAAALTAKAASSAPSQTTATPNPQTGDRTAVWPWLAPMLAALLGCSALALGRKGGCGKRRE